MIIDNVVSECHCGKLELLEAGLEVDVSFCGDCGKWAASSNDYYNNFIFENICKNA